MSRAALRLVKPIVDDGTLGGYWMRHQWMLAQLDQPMRRFCRMVLVNIESQPCCCDSCADWHALFVGRRFTSLDVDAAARQLDKALKPRRARKARAAARPSLMEVAALCDDFVRENPDMFPVKR